MSVPNPAANYGDDPDEVLQQTQTKKSTDKKCPACGGPLGFSPATGGPACEFCGHEEAIESDTPAAASPAAEKDSADSPGAALAEGAVAATAKVAKNSGEEAVKELDFLSAAHTENCDWGAKKKTVTCKSCGAQSIYDALQVADCCPYCDSTQVMEEAAEDALAPNGVCPFKITQEEARKKFKEWIASLWFRPNDLKKNNTVDNFTGVYLPFWTFDANTDSKYLARYGIDHTEKDEDGKEETVTDWYDCHGDFTRAFDDVLLPATSRHDHAILRGLADFDLKNCLPYKPEFIAGFVAERYSIGLKESWKDAQDRIDDKLRDEIRDVIVKKHKADRADITTLNTNYSDITYKYLMLPLWLSNFHYRGKLYQFMVNGRTGTVDGYAPYSWWKIFFAILLGLIIFFGFMHFSN